MTKRYPLKKIRREMTSTDLRGAFIDVLGAYEQWEDREPEPTIELGHRHVPISAACRLLSDYSDMMPNYKVDWVREFLPEGQRMRPTYGSAARQINRLIKAQKASAG